MYENEVWKEIKNYPQYEVSSCGRVRSLKRRAPHILKAGVKHDGYLQVHLWKEGKGHAFSIARLVAEAFIPNPDNLPEIDHIDRNRMNNCIENLRWASRAEQNANRSKNRGHSIGTKLQVLCVETNQIFDNSAAAARWIREQGLSDSAINGIARRIRRVCNKDYGCKTAYGYHWEFDEK